MHATTALLGAWAMLLLIVVKMCHRLAELLVVSVLQKVAKWHLIS